MLILALTLTAQADEYFGAIGETQPIGDSAGTWPRLLPRGDGAWWFVIARGGTLFYEPMSAELESEEKAKKLMHREDLIDHTIVVCPDGTFIDAASAHTNDLDDTLYFFRYTLDDMSKVDNELIEYADELYVYNDSPAVCTEELVGVGGFNTRDGAPMDSATNPSTWFYRLGEGVEVIDTWPVTPDPSNAGGTWLVSQDGKTAHLLRTDANIGLLRTDYDIETGEVVNDRVELGNVFGEDVIIGWASSVMWLDDTIYLVGLGQPDGAYTPATGDVFLAAMDADWNVLDVVNVTDYGGARNELGGFQPGMTYQDGIMMITHTKEANAFVNVIDMRAITNEPPVVDAGADQTVEPGATVSFSGTAEDPEGEELSVEWSLSSSPEGSAASLTVDGLSGSFVADLEGDYVLTLSASDAYETVTDSLTVTATTEPIDSDPGTDDSEPGTDDSQPGEEPTPQDPESCSGCSGTGSGAAALLVLAGAALLRRRSSKGEQAEQPQ